MKDISTSKKRYYKLDKIGHIGTQEKRSARQIKIDAAKTTRIIKGLKSTGNVFKAQTVSARNRKVAKFSHA